jgi:DNA-binding CsgD family transcriptional regulator
VVSFTRREKEVLELTKQGVKSDEVIAQQLGMQGKKQVSVHRSHARRKVVAAKKFVTEAMKQYGDILFPGVNKTYKGINDQKKPLSKSTVDRYVEATEKQEQASKTGEEM